MNCLTVDIVNLHFVVIQILFKMSIFSLLNLLREPMNVGHFLPYIFPGTLWDISVTDAGNVSSGGLN